MFLKAPWIVTMTGDAIAEGAVRTEGDRIAAVGTEVKPTRADATIRLDGCVLMPGLVDAHAHLDLSYLAGCALPRHSFTAWAEAIVAARRRADARAIADGLRAALQQCYQSGITCIGDHVGHLEILPFLLQTPLRGRAFLEVIGPTEERARAALHAAIAAGETHGRAARRMRLDVTAHAPYSVHPTILRELLVKAKAEAGAAICSLHCAETAEEWECFTACRGPLYSFVTQAGLPLTTPSRSPIEYCERHGGLPPRGCFIHANYVDAADLAGIRAVHGTIVHCPQSHRAFGARPFPYDTVRAAGVPVALGTDSLATAERLNLFTEMHLLREANPEISAHECCAMVTVNGARALGLDDVCGVIAPGYKADLIAVRIVDRRLDPYENVVRNAEVPFVVIDGRIVRNVLKGDH